VYGEASLSTLIYLPGLHGDWTLVGSFRRAISGRVRFVEMTYPRTLTWSLEDYAQAIETALAERGIARGWLAGESFGSQVLWALVGGAGFRPTRLFSRAVSSAIRLRWGVRAVQRIGGSCAAVRDNAHPLRLCQGGAVPLRALPEGRWPASVSLSSAAPSRTARRPSTACGLIAQNDPCPIARQVKIPVYALSGLIDPLVRGSACGPG